MGRRVLSVIAVIAGLACSRANEKSGPVPPPRNDAQPSLDGGAGSGGLRATQLAIGHDHTCASIADGSVRCWGLGAEGRLGTASTTSIGDDESARNGNAVDLGGRATAITAGSAHTCALMETKRVRCWGRGQDGQLGYGSPDAVGDDETPASRGDVTIAEDVLAIAAGGSATCALLASGEIRCWGDNLDGALGLPGKKQPRRVGDDERVDSLPTIVLDRQVAQIAASRSEVCARFIDGRVRCWGEVFGSIDPDHAATNRTDIDVGASVARLSAGTLMCVITKARRARCWGSGESLLDAVGVQANTGDDHLVLADVGDLPLPGDVERASLSGDHGCALFADGSVRCWGDNRLGILGVPPGAYVPVKDSVPVDIGAAATDLAVGAFHSCVLTREGAVRCWGMAKDGRLGYGTAENVGERRPPREAGDVL